MSARRPPSVRPSAGRSVGVFVSERLCTFVRVRVRVRLRVLVLVRVHVFGAH